LIVNGTFASADQVLTDPVHVLGDDGVVDNFGLALDLLRQLFAERDLFVQGPEIDAFANVAIADFFGIFLLVVGKGAVRQKSQNCQAGHGHG
jgi:hypothetical protein